MFVPSQLRGILRQAHVLEAWDVAFTWDVLKSWCCLYRRAVSLRQSQGKAQDACFHRKTYVLCKRQAVCAAPL